MKDATAGGSDHWRADSPESLIHEITSALAREQGVDPLELEPLNNFVDVDALIRLVDSFDEKQRSSFASVTFYVDGYEVHVEQDGSVDVELSMQSLRTQDDSTRSARARNDGE